MQKSETIEELLEQSGEVDAEVPKAEESTEADVEPVRLTQG